MLRLLLQLEIEKLKAENDRLKLENQGSRCGSQASIISSPLPHTQGQGPGAGSGSGSGSGPGQQSLNLTSSESSSLGERMSNYEAQISRSSYEIENKNFFSVHLSVRPHLAPDMLLDDGGGEGGGARKEGRRVKIVVSLDDSAEWVEVSFHTLLLHCSHYCHLSITHPSSIHLLFYTVGGTCCFYCLDEVIKINLF